jgi:hypothetical protein
MIFQEAEVGATFLQLAKSIGHVAAAFSALTCRNSSVTFLFSLHGICRPLDGQACLPSDCARR